MSALARVTPIDPDADEARRWLEEELAKEIYQGERSNWLQSVFDWLNRQLGRLDGPTGDASVDGVPGVVVGIVILAALIAVVIYLVMGPLRQSRRAKASASVFEDDNRSADDMLTAAEAAAARGDWDQAVLERFRSIVREAESRRLVAVIPGMTAYEFVSAAATRLADLGPDLLWSGDLFDNVRYGHAHGSRDAYERLEGLATALSHARARRVKS